MMWLGPFLRQQKLTSSIETTITNNIEEVVEDTVEETVNVDENPESEYQIFEIGLDEILSPTPLFRNCPGSSHSQRSTLTFRQEKAKVHERMTNAIESFTEICEKKNITLSPNKKTKVI
ncbi:hypothetical protein FQA39_LY17341 [Lamprigera yunnana]|nr:hypothetical protein FQA39_LY17341 [Lamprigera yunnana]